MRKFITCILTATLLTGIYGCNKPDNSYITVVDSNKILGTALPLFNEKRLPKNLRKNLTVDWQLPIPMNKGGEIKDAWLEYDMLLLQSEFKRNGKPRFNFMAIDRETGKMIWVVELLGKVQFRPTVTMHSVFIVSQGELISIERVSGSIRWSIRPKNISIGSQLVVIEPPSYPKELDTGTNYDMEQIFFAGYDRKVHGMQVVARKRTLAPAIMSKGIREEALVEPTFQLRRMWSKIAGGDVPWAPFLFKKNIYFGTTDSTIYCIGLDGEEIFHHRVQGPIRSPIRGASDSIFFGSEDSFLYSLVAGEEKILWVQPLEGMVTRDIFVDHNDPRNKLLFVPVRPLSLEPENPTLRARMLCIRHEKEADDGAPNNNDISNVKRKAEHVETLWTVDDAMAVLGISRDIVYLGGQTLLPGSDYDTIPMDLIIAVEKKTGKELWSSVMPTSIFKQLVVYDQKIDTDKINLRTKTRIYAITNTNHVLCFVEPTRETEPYTIPKADIPKSERMKSGK